jgi:phosphoribosylformylglycinamidine synthase subunit PurS
VLFTVQIEITLKPTVMDAQGTVIEKALHKLGHETVRNVRIGKFVTLEIDACCPDMAKEAADEMCRELLANMIIEQFDIQVMAVEAA